MASPFLKIFFVTDIHGSNSCFKKFINATRRRDPPDLLILGGDITGKYVVPLIERRDGVVELGVDGDSKRIPKDSVPAFEEELADSGCYVYRCTEDDFRKHKFDPQRQRSIARKLQIERLNRWLSFARERLSGTDTKLIINCGNDDAYYMDEILKNDPVALFPENCIVDLPQGLSLLSIGYSNPTPWKCARELPEERLRERIAKLASKVPGGYRRTIFNFHCPPKDTALDLAPKLDEELRPQIGLHGPEFSHVGSTAVRSAIETLQPVLALHGHVHEQHVIEKIGLTTCANPGSSYWTGSLQGVMVTFRDGELAGCRLTSEKSTEQSSVIERVLGAGLTSLLPVLGHPLTAMAHQLEIEHLRRETEQIKDAIRPHPQQAPATDKSRDSER